MTLLAESGGHLSKPIICVLVHSWELERAVTFMLDHTAYSRNDIVSEVHRYITWPGQACAYKIGEMKIRQLRERAMEALGDVNL